MVQQAIRCRPCVSVPTDDPEGRLEQHVSEPRAATRQASVRLSRLTRAGQAADLEIGWLDELQLAGGEPLLAGHRLADAPRDMRPLGLQPTLVAPRGSWRNGGAA